MLAQIAHNAKIKYDGNKIVTIDELHKHIDNSEKIDSFRLFDNNNCHNYVLFNINYVVLKINHNNVIHYGCWKYVDNLCFDFDDADTIMDIIVNKKFNCDYVSQIASSDLYGKILSGKLFKSLEECNHLMSIIKNIKNEMVNCDFEKLGQLLVTLKSYEESNVIIYTILMEAGVEIVHVPWTILSPFLMSISGSDWLFHCIEIKKLDNIKQLCNNWANSCLVKQLIAYKMDNDVHVSDIISDILLKCNKKIDIISISNLNEISNKADEQLSHNTFVTPFEIKYFYIKNLSQYETTQIKMLKEYVCQYIDDLRILKMNDVLISAFSHNVVLKSFSHDNNNTFNFDFEDIIKKSYTVTINNLDLFKCTALQNNGEIIYEYIEIDNVHIKEGYDINLSSYDIDMNVVSEVFNFINNNI